MLFHPYPPSAANFSEMNYICFFTIIMFKNKNEMITLLCWLFLPKILTNPFIKFKKQDIRTSIYTLCNEN